jgi:hypothetical protein
MVGSGHGLFDGTMFTQRVHALQFVAMETLDCVMRMVRN